MLSHCHILTTRRARRPYPPGRHAARRSASLHCRPVGQVHGLGACQAGWFVHLLSYGFDERAHPALAAHKSVLFFRENDTERAQINYSAAVAGHRRLVPDEIAQDILAADYRKMLDDGLLPIGAELFEEITIKCADIQ